MVCLLRYLLLFFFISTAQLSSAIAQNNERTLALTNDLRNAKSDTVKLRLLNSLFLEFCFSNPEKANTYNQQILELGKHSGNAEANGQFYHNEGISLSIAGNFSKSIESYFEAIKINQQAGNTLAAAKTYANIGIVYSQLQDDSLALIYYFKALKVANEVRDQKLILNCNNNIGTIYVEMNKLDFAKHYLLNAVALYENLDNTVSNQSNSFNRIIGPVYSNLGNVYLKLELLDSALLFLNKADTSYRLDNNKFQIAQNSIIFGRVFGRKNDFDKSLKHLLNALKINEEINSIEIKHRVYWELYQAYHKKQDYKKALEYHELYTFVKDTIYDENKTKIIQELQTKYETQERQQEIERQQITIEKRNYLIYFISAILVLLAIIATLSISQMRIKERRNSVELKQKLLRTQMNPHFIFNALTSIQGSVLEKKPHEAADYISKFASLMRMILEHSNEEFITIETEIDILNYYLELQQLRYSHAFDFKISVLQNNASANVGNILIPPMLAQPFIENAIEHGIVKQCTKGFIDIRFELLEDEILFTVENYCIEKLKESLRPGFSPSTKKDHKPMAISITQERLHYLNKELKDAIQFEITEGERATVSFRFPLLT